MSSSISDLVRRPVIPSPAPVAPTEVQQPAPETPAVEPGHSPQSTFEPAPAEAAPVELSPAETPAETPVETTPAPADPNAALREERARARELDRLQQPGGRPLTDGLRQRTEALTTARADLDARNRQLQQGLQRLGATADPAVRQRFTESFRGTPEYQQAVERERTAARDLATFTRDNLEGLSREYPDGNRLERARGGLEVRHALSALAESSEAGAAIDLAGQANRLGNPPLLPQNRLEQIVGTAAPHAYLQAIEAGQTAQQAEAGLLQSLRGAIRYGDLGRKLEKTHTTLAALTEGVRTLPQTLRAGLQAASAAHTTVRAYENAANGQNLDALRDGFKSAPELAGALREMFSAAGLNRSAEALKAVTDSRLMRTLGGASGAAGVVSNALEFARTNDWRYALAGASEAVSGLAAAVRFATPQGRAANAAIAAGGAVAGLTTTLARGSVQGSELSAGVLPHLTAALGGNERAARVFLNNPRAIETMRQLGLSEEEIVRRAGDPNQPFITHGADIDQLREHIRAQQRRAISAR